MNRKLPGTNKNFERCGDRDLYWSMLLRFPTPGRSLDTDTFPELGPQILCNKCHLPKLLMESVRGSEYKHSYITEAWAKELKCAAYVVCHDGEWFPTKSCKTKEECEELWTSRKRSQFFKIEGRPVSDERNFCIYEGDVEEAFVQWVETVMSQHRCPKP